jgi:hypothetical protein
MRKQSLWSIFRQFEIPVGSHTLRDQHKQVDVAANGNDTAEEPTLPLLPTALTFRFPFISQLSTVPFVGNRMRWAGRA